MRSVWRILMVAVVGALMLVGGGAVGAELLVGAASVDITPEPPVVLAGMQIADRIQSRCTANALALESRDGHQVVDQAIMVSCDLCILPGIQDGFRKHVADRLPGFDVNKLFLAAAHTHSAMMVLKNQYDEKDYCDAVQPDRYVPFLYAPDMLGRWRAICAQVHSPFIPEKWQSV